ncbi:thioredoxin family protein [Breznakiella homolactica]|uniref:TM0996/MTH895 family glutaredoxin-like protein n=1 Tax=Breznakiella homolactica TaxID=2798577 RepID=A0A7T8B945_9SPIR|nr:thioredoxin family protein [Breznakiella homolactica]QQO07565.1 thioredoxin family protein [Breznakiella homolactica]
MVIKILGSGCRNCLALGDNVKKALNNLGKEAEVIKVTDLEEMMKYGILSTPGLVIDETLVSSGKLLKPAEIEKLLSNPPSKDSAPGNSGCSCGCDNKQS